jgi:anti-sigma B factor antagonist
MSILEITTDQNGDEAVVKFTGSLDTTTSEQAKTDLEQILGDEITSAVFDFTALEYISSAGLRLMLICKATLDGKSAKFSITNANSQVADVFKITGLSDLLR